MHRQRAFDLGTVLHAVRAAQCAAVASEHEYLSVFGNGESTHRSTGLRKWPPICLPRRTRIVARKYLGTRRTPQPSRLLRIDGERIDFTCRQAGNAHLPVARAVIAHPDVAVDYRINAFGRARYEHQRAHGGFRPYAIGRTRP